VVGKLSVRLGDVLAETPYGRCVGERIAARAIEFEPPPETTRAEATFRLDPNKEKRAGKNPPR
jgi:hypothetical protein